MYVVKCIGSTRVTVRGVYSGSNKFEWPWAMSVYRKPGYRIINEVGKFYARSNDARSNLMGSKWTSDLNKARIYHRKCDAIRFIGIYKDSFMVIPLFIETTENHENRRTVS